MIGYIRAILIPMTAVMVLALVSTGCSAGEAAKTPALVDVKTDKTTDPGKPESVFSKATGVTSNTPTPIHVPTATVLPTPMPAVIAPGAVPTPVPTPFPDRSLFGMPLHVNGTPLEPYQDAFAIPCGFITFDPPANKRGVYYQGTKITVTVHPLDSGTTVVLGVASSSGGKVIKPHGIAKASWYGSSGVPFTCRGIPNKLLSGNGVGTGVGTAPGAITAGIGVGSTVAVGTWIGVGVFEVTPVAFEKTDSGFPGSVVLSVFTSTKAGVLAASPALHPVDTNAKTITAVIGIRIALI
jgi:hypothetical protein